MMPGPAEAAPTFDDPLGMLEACHRRIERALAVAERITVVERQGPLDDRGREAVRQMLHYFATGVPRHSQDEEGSLFPRLREALAGGDEAGWTAVERLAQEHEALDAAHRELDELAQDLLRAGCFDTEERRSRFAAVTATLQALYREHIRIEDEQVFPLAARVMEAGRLAEVGAEMAARRGIDWAERQAEVERLRSRPWLQRPER